MLKNNRGIALLITISVIAVLVAVTFELNRQIQSSTSKTAVSRDLLALQHMIFSGVSIAETILVKDRENTEIDSIQEDWASREVIEQYLKRAGFEKDSISLEITDELSRLQINALVEFPGGKIFNPDQRKLWTRFFDLLISRLKNEKQDFFSESLEPAMIINPVKDWLDSGENDTVTGLTGAETDYYSTMDPPYSCRNGPFRDVSELLRVRNIDPEMFFSPGDKNVSLRDLITVHGMVGKKQDPGKFSYPGRININTAPPQILAALLPAGQEFLAGEIAAYRKEKAGGQFVHDLTDENWYKNVAGMEDVDINKDLITRQSDLFCINCTVKLNQARLSATVVVKREKDPETGKWKCRVLNWRFE